MIRVMVVEDEAPILRSIKHAIESTNPQFEVVATAYNGEEAILQLQKIAVDIIFTDIGMPIIDGITLITHIKQHYPLIMPIIISGYQEFEYARKAINLGVINYLLKPLSMYELKQLLDAIVLQVEIQNNQIMDKYVYALLHNEPLERLAAAATLEQGSYFLMLLCAGSFPNFSMDDYSPIADVWNKINLACMFGEMVESKQKFWVVDGKTESEKMILCSNQVNMILVDMQILAERLLERVGTALGVPLTLVISPEIETVEEIGIKAQMMRAALSKKISIGVSQIISLSQKSDLVHGMLKLDAYMERKITLAIEQNHFEMFKQELYELIQQWKNTPMPQFIVEKILKEITHICHKQFQHPSSYFAQFFELDLNLAVVYATDYDELLKYLLRVFELAFTIERENGQMSESSMLFMVRIEEYLIANLAEPVNHQTLSDKFGLVPSYLSKLFSKYKGMSPSKYLVILRVQRAKELMASQPSLLMKDIAGLVGYADALYFSKIFKKETGVWPSEYKGQ
jgi:two-component system response regulator YesN